MVTVAVCALTFQRPRGLERLLAGLAALDVDQPRLAVSILIVDNDPAGSARPIVEAAAPRTPLPLRYVVEQERGIPVARNRAVAEAGAADFVAFIDDDEVPDPRWLVELLAVQRRTGADAVTGPVLPRFEPAPPRWVSCGRFFDRPRYPDAAPLDGATTSSVLISRRVLSELGLRFDEAMRLSGGSDTDFFLRLRAAGGTISWAERAIVVETIPPSRTTARWILTRQYRRGLTFSHCLVALDGRTSRRLRRGGKGIVRMASSVPAAAAALRWGCPPRTAAVRGLQRVCHGWGMIVGLFGVSYQEYATIHGE